VSVHCAVLCCCLALQFLRALFPAAKGTIWMDLRGQSDESRRIGVGPERVRSLSPPPLTSHSTSVDADADVDAQSD
jgi:hypothetical protein